MMTIDQIQDDVVEEFSAFDDWMDKYALLIELGNSLAPLDPQYKVESNLIEGCQSRVWLHAEYDDGRVVFQAESDAEEGQGGLQTDHRSGAVCSRRHFSRRGVFLMRASSRRACERSAQARLASSRTGRRARV